MAKSEIEFKVKTSPQLQTMLEILVNRADELPEDLKADFLDCFESECSYDVHYFRSHGFETNRVSVYSRSDEVVDVEWINKKLKKVYGKIGDMEISCPIELDSCRVEYKGKRLDFCSWD